MKMEVLVYRAPNTRKHRRIPLGPRQLTMLECLRNGACSRLDMLAWGRPWLALSAPQTVRSLRGKGIAIHTEMETGRNADGAAVRFARYKLLGRVVRVEGGRK